ncbi:type VI secretion system tip protein TssI/VgrG [Mesorhizobium sp. CAU 1741]|uniref:type VI secretion system Vgr family protein n=1 Tax=Mesorhizobium sp. CAU 1741 TaxID=3140366 RepID=UPI00325AE88A
MSDALVQAERWLTLETPLGPNALVATEASGIEGISRPFDFTVLALSTESTIQPQDLLGKSVTLSMARPGGKRRKVNGIVVSLAGGELTRSNYRLYTLRLAPSLWLLDRTSDYKVFQDRTAVEIVEELLGDSSVTFEKKLTATYDKREYCVQFGETDLAFMQRLLSEEGIFYFFTHKDGEHKLVLADHAAAYVDGLQDKVEYHQGDLDSVDSVHRMEFGASLTDAKWALADYDFTAPQAAREGERKTSLQPASGKSWEHYLYPAGSVKDATITRLAGVAVDAVESGFEVANGAGTCASFTPGHRFTLTEHNVEALKNTKHVVTEVRHEAVDRAHFTIRPGMEGKPFYRNSFTAIPSTRIARSPLSQPKPVARGPQTALVVGPQGQEIHTDKYGRIRVQFHWDRYGKKDEKSSCFVHVAQAMAGAGWGSLFLPRIGMEVVVQFLDGNPDRPVVTGAVYNGTNAPPWALPANMTKSGFLSRSTLDGASANANELSFEDKKGEEKVLFHAEKDFVREVENDDTLDVGNDQTRTIKNNRKTTITDGNDETIISQGNRTETISKGNEKLTVSTGNREVTIHGNEALTLNTGNRTTDITKGNDNLTLAAGNHVTKASTGKITLEATAGITLKCGGSTIEITQQGIKINGLQIALKGGATAKISAPMVDVAGDAMAQIKGGVVKIN